MERKCKMTHFTRSFGCAPKHADSNFPNVFLWKWTGLAMDFTFRKWQKYKQAMYHFQNRKLSVLEMNKGS